MFDITFTLSVYVRVVFHLFVSLCASMQKHFFQAIQAFDVVELSFKISFSLSFSYAKEVRQK